MPSRGRTKRYSLIVAAVLVGTGPGVAQGQVRREVRFSPGIGVYMPLGGPMIDEPGLRKQQIITGLAIGRLVFWFHPRFGIEGAMQYGKGQVAVRDSTAARVVSDLRATLWLANLRALVRLTPDTHRRLSMYVGSGLGVVGRSGQAFLDTPATPDESVVFVAGGTAVLGKGKRGPAFRFELEDNVSRSQFNVGLPNQTRALTHHDIIWSLGLSFALWSTH
ncbi:MAG: hypothetical protein EXR93_11635 [Gemmatimonadetes bacterium]|nr:hypothetical protein [Gemmatimonadota bacterium]